MHYLITGHTGFKGTWLSMLLQYKGHEVSGISLDPIKDSLYGKINQQKHFKNDLRVDIRDRLKLVKAFQIIEPDVVIHLAAQPLVRESYRDPVTTYDTNILGTLNVLEATKLTDSIKAQLVITTDKVYKNLDKKSGYIEEDELGGHDPYSTSKAIADMLTQSWVKSINACPTAIARAGNVIGGGDVSSDRLIPDLVNSFQNSSNPILRYPNAVRPWQHVLDCLNGYLLLVEKLLEKNTKEIGVWNFGPNNKEMRTVSEVAELVSTYWGNNNKWEKDRNLNPHETSILKLNSEKARSILNWRDKLDFSESIDWTSRWYKDVFSGMPAEFVSLKNIIEFENKI